MRLDPDSQVISLLSIPRDLKVLIPKSKFGGLAHEFKINEAYTDGGPDLTAKVVKNLLGGPRGNFKINHILNVNFGGFRAVVDKLGCIYQDVDRRYFNDNNPPAGGGGLYATVHVQAGYQKLCGQDALDYVRFRHLDTDIVRAARQQDFLRSIKQQVTGQKLLDDEVPLEKLFGKYVESDHDLRTTRGVLNLLNLVLFSQGHTIRQVKFPAILGPSFVTVDPAALRKTVRQFLAPVTKAKPKPKPKGKPKKKKGGGDLGLTPAKNEGENQAIVIGPKMKFPLYYPKLLVAGSRYDGPPPRSPRVYRIRDYKRHLHQSYRLVVILNSGEGQYYGIQGTTWQDPPILVGSHDEQRVNGRKLLIYYDGKHVRYVAWRTGKGVYWVANTLTEDLTNKQMLAIAGSLTKLGKK
jgi:LCP family protein required for cell wall assembly